MQYKGYTYSKKTQFVACLQFEFKWVLCFSICWVWHPIKVLEKGSGWDGLSSVNIWKSFLKLERSYAIQKMEEFQFGWNLVWTGGSIVTRNKLGWIGTKLLL